MALASALINPLKRMRDPEPLNLHNIPQVLQLYIPSPAILGPDEEIALRNAIFPSTSQVADLFLSSTTSSVTEDDLEAIDSVMSPSTNVHPIAPTLNPIINTNKADSSLLRSDIATLSDSSFDSLPMRPQKRAKCSLRKIEERPHTCAACQASFTIRGDLRRHIKTVHEGKRKFKCSKCPKIFAHSGHLNRHWNSVHLGIRKHKCTTCGDAFFQASHLKSHIKHVHHRHKPWVCEHCDVRLATESALRNHMRIHHSNETFQCPDNKCNKQFGLASDLGRHCQQAHGHSS